MNGHVFELAISLLFLKKERLNKLLFAVRMKLIFKITNKYEKM